MNISAPTKDPAKKKGRPKVYNRTPDVNHSDTTEDDDADFQAYRQAELDAAEASYQKTLKEEYPGEPLEEKPSFVAPVSNREGTLPGEISIEEDLDANLKAQHDALEKDLDRELKIVRKELLLARYRRMIRELQEKPVQETINIPDILKTFQGAMADAQKTTAQAITQGMSSEVEATAIQAQADDKAKDPINQLIGWATQNPQAVAEIVSKFIPNLKGGLDNIKL